jgi:hypothetical protein
MTDVVSMRMMLDATPGATRIGLHGCGWLGRAAPPCRLLRASPARAPAGSRSITPADSGVRLPTPYPGVHE